MQNLASRTLISLLAVFLLQHPAMVWSAVQGEKSDSCEELLGTSQLRYRFGRLSTIESLAFGDISGKTKPKRLLAYLFGSTIQSEGRLPTSSELVKSIEGIINRRAKEILTSENKSVLKNRNPEGGSTADFIMSRDEAVARATNELNPTIKSILNKPGPLIGKGGIFENYQDLLKLLNVEFPDVYKGTRGKIHKQAFLFFRHRMRPPSFRELAKILKFEDEVLLQQIILTPHFWDEGLFSDIGRHIDYARKRIKTAYARALRGTDTPAANRTRRVSIELSRLVEVMAITKSNEHYRWRAQTGDYGKFNLTTSNEKANREQAEAMMASLSVEMGAILGQVQIPNDNPRMEDRWVFDMPVLFPGGLPEVETLTRSEYQPTFTSFKDINKYPQKYAEFVKQKIVEAPGVILTSITPGWEVDWDFVEAMVRMAKHKGYSIVLMPTNGSTQDLDPKLLKYPEIMVLTATIENKELLLSNLPTNLSDNPQNNFKKPGMFKVGQQIILAGHFMLHETIPTSKNAINPTQVFIPGTINAPKVPAVGKFQEAKAIKVSRQMKRGFLVLEKIDKGVDNEYGGATNAWHPRPVEYKPPSKEVPGLFVDVDSAYIIDKKDNGETQIVKKKTPVATIYAPDVHFLANNPRIMTAFKQLLAKLKKDGVEVTIVFPDPIESKAINHHVEKKQQNRDSLNQLMTSGQIFFEDELNDAISNVNVLLSEFKDAVLVFQYSNHSDEWIEKNLVNQPTWLQLIANGPLIDEMRFACKMNGWSPLEYLLLHRKAFLERSSVDGSDGYKERAVFVSDTQRVRTMRRGEPLTSAPDMAGWEVSLQHHGHQGANGGRSSFKTHAIGEQRAIFGDAHRPFYYGYGENFVVGVGVMSLGPEFTYTEGGYSGWDGTLAIVSSFNTIQALKFDPHSLSYIQRRELGVLEGEQFFGDDPLIALMPMDNDGLRRDRDRDEYMEWLLKDAKYISQRRIQAPTLQEE